MQVTIRVLNWHRFNPRSDVKNHSWFRIQNTLPTCPGIHGLPHNQRWLWVTILALCSQKQRDELQVDTSYLAHVAQLNESEVLEGLKAFAHESRRWIATPDDVTPASRARDADVPNPTVDVPLRTYERTNEQGASAVRDKLTPEQQKRLVDEFGEKKMEWALVDADQWLKNNPSKKIKNWVAFMRNWLAKERKPPAAPAPKKTVNTELPLDVPDFDPLLPGPTPPWRKTSEVAK